MMGLVGCAKAVLYYERLWSQAPVYLPSVSSAVDHAPAPALLMCSWHALRGGPVPHAVSDRARVSQRTTQG